jgi:hypothetical protein
MAKELIKGGNNETLGYLIDQGNRKEIHDPAGFGEQLMRLLEK